VLFAIDGAKMTEICIELTLLQAEGEAALSVRD